MQLHELEFKPLERKMGGVKLLHGGNIRKMGGVKLLHGGTIRKMKRNSFYRSRVCPITSKVLSFKKIEIQ